MSVIVYSIDTCSYCSMAKNWLFDNRIEYDEIILDNQVNIERFKEECPDKTSIPQIIVNGELIGGYDDLMEKQEYVLGVLKS